LPARRDPGGDLPPLLVPHAVLDGRELDLLRAPRGPGRRRGGVVGARGRLRGRGDPGPADAALTAAGRGGPPAVGAPQAPVGAWAAYELGATGFAMVVLSFHLPLDIASRVARGSEKFSLAFVLSMVVVVLTAPLLGSLGDAKGKRRFLVPCVLLGVAGTA